MELSREIFHETKNVHQKKNTLDLIRYEGYPDQLLLISQKPGEKGDVKILNCKTFRCR